MVEIAYKWHPIEDLTQEEYAFCDSSLDSLAEVWNEQRDELTQKGVIGEFLKRLQRQWAIETGVIERIYTLDVGVTQVLIENGIDANLITHESTNKDPVLVTQIIKDQYDVVDGLFDFVKQCRSLSTSYIKEMHAGFCRNQKTTVGVDQFGNVHDVKLHIGEYKTMPNSPTQSDGNLHEYCPPEQTASEMDRLIELHLLHLEKNVSPIVEAAWLHHRFAQIHPFQDGNGRIARALASLILIKAGWFPLTVTRDEREEYITALEDADKGNLIPLIQLFARIQRKTLTSALGIAGQVKASAQVSSIIDSIKLELDSRKINEIQAREKAKDFADLIVIQAGEELQNAADMLKNKLGSFWEGRPPYVYTASNNSDKDYYFRNQIIMMAKKHNYFANPALYKAWSRLVLPGKNQSEILVSAHGIGYEYRGVIVVSACFFNRSKDMEQNDVGDFNVLGREYFQITYKEKKQDLLKRFQDWINQVIGEGIAIWGRTI